MEDEIDFYKISNVINQVDELINNQVGSINTLVSNKELQGICKKYEKNKSELSDIGFNVFTIVSDKSYREKFHSQIIAAILNPQEKHNEGNKFLDVFLQYLNDKHLQDKHEIDISDYKDAVVTGTKDIGEKGFIDIWIRGQKKCIIIENKIYNANDRHLQIPRYFDYAEKEGYKDNIDAIIYLSLDGKKTITDISNWNDKEQREKIENKLLKIAAFNYGNGKEEDLYHGWIIPATNIATNIDALLILRQYGKLIKSLNKTTMNNQIMENFYNKIIKNNDNYKTALSIISMVDELPQYLAQRIVDEFTNDHPPFKDIKPDKEVAVFSGGEINENNFTMRITCEMDKYTFRFWDENFHENGIKNAKDIINKLGYVEFYEEDNELKKDFKFTKVELLKAEEKILKFIKEFKDKLNELVRSK